MSDSASTTPKKEGPLPYNTPATARQRKKARFFNAPDSLEGYYSPFWPLLIIFFAFIVLLVYEIWFLRFRTVMLNTQITHLVGSLQKANAQTTFIEGVHKDLSALAPTHPDADQLLKEFFPAIPAAPEEPLTAPSGTEAPPATSPPHP
jgi:hypothetical protein